MPSLHFSATHSSTPKSSILPIASHPPSPYPVSVAHKRNSIPPGTSEREIIPISASPAIDRPGGTTAAPGSNNQPLCNLCFSCYHRQG
jgi:hypothetical protein